MMKKLCCIVLLLSLPCFGQLKTHSFAEAVELSKEKPKPFVIFVHTSWCKYCHMMQQATFKNPEVIALLNEHFYFIPFDAETRTPIAFNNHIFHFRPNGTNSGTHELAAALATKNETLAYPTLTILQADYSILVQKQSFADAETVRSLLLEILRE